MRLHRCGIAVFFVLAALAPNPSAAQAPHLTQAPHLAWSGPAGCPDEATVTDRVRRLAPALELAGDVTVQVQRERGRFVVQITTTDGARTLDARRCDVLGDAVALVIANAMVPPALETPTEPTVPTPPIDVARREDEPDTADVEAPEDEDEAQSDVLRAVFASTTEFVYGVHRQLEIGGAQSVGLRVDGFEVSVRWTHAQPLEHPSEVSIAALRIGWIGTYDIFEASFRMIGQVGATWSGLNVHRSMIFGTVGAGLEGRVWLTDWLGATVGGELGISVTPTTRALGAEVADVALPTSLLAASLGLVIQAE